MLYYMCRQVDAAGGALLCNHVQKRREGDIMTDYEILMIVISFLTLLIAVDSKNRK